MFVKFRSSGIRGDGHVTAVVVGMMMAVMIMMGSSVRPSVTVDAAFVVSSSKKVSCPSSFSFARGNHQWHPRHESLSILPSQSTMMMVLRMTTTDGDKDDDSTSSSTDVATTTTEKKLSLEEKMKSWEATDEERRAATLGGVIPESLSSSSSSNESAERSDAFDVGLYIAFPIMVLSGLFFALFPFIMGNLDVDSVGPPPTI